MKTCTKCGGEYSTSRCKPCWAAYMKEYSKTYRKGPSGKAASKAYRERTKEKQKGYRLKQDFGITLEQYQQMLEEQSGVCACCGKPETATYNKTGVTKQLAVDHDHATGEIRGLLCGRCNTALGLLQDSEDTIMSLLTYLSKER